MRSGIRSRHGSGNICTRCETRPVNPAGTRHCKPCRRALEQSSESGAKAKRCAVTVVQLVAQRTPWTNRHAVRRKVWRYALDVFAD